MSAARRTIWLLVAPPAVMVGLRSVLEMLVDRQPQALALPLIPVSAPGSLMALVWPAFAVVAVAAAVALLVRQLGWRRVRAAAAVVWVLLWLAGSGALIQRHLNQQGLRPLPSAMARTLASQFKPPSLRSAGGTQLYLQVPGLQTPHTVIIDDPELAQLKPGDTLVLNLAQGRFDGLFVTGWQPPRAAIAPPAGSLR